jgi:hypothetical protein
MSHTISFIYRIAKTSQTYYGKFLTDKMSDDHDGLDVIIRPKLTYALNRHRRLNNKGKLKQSIFIGVLAYSNTWMNFSTEREVKCFDFLYEQYTTKDGVDVEDYWVSGELLSNLEKASDEQVSSVAKDDAKEEFVELQTEAAAA